MHSNYRRLVRFLGSNTFFWVIMLVFTLSAVWIAVSARYPMAFDESYHLGLIRLHALQWSPIFTHQPVGVAEFGALTRDPSYLFHWFMSFPYRLLTSMGASQMTLVVTLRLINVGMFAVGLFFLRPLLHKTKASPAAINTALLFFVLTPVIPLLAATINYDNLQIILIILALTWVLQFRQHTYESKKFDLKAFVGTLVVSMLGCLVKFTFLPVLTAITIYIVYLTVRFHRHKLLATVKKTWRVASSAGKVSMVIPFTIAVALFLNTYGVNIVEYHNPIPQCGQVLDVERCAAYPPWYRNYLAAQNNKGVDPNPIKYTGNWIGGMFDRLFFTINGHGDPASNANSLAPIMSAAAALLMTFGVYLLARYGRRLLKNDGVMGFLLFTTLVYFVSVWGRNYHDYIQLGRIVAVNGRYLVPFVPFLYVLTAMAYQQFLAGRTKAKLVILSLSLLLFTQGGGAISFIYYSTTDWYWPNAQVRNLNKNAQKVINPLFITWYLKK